MAGCVPCVIIPMILFIFHRYIQPLILKFWNPFEKTPEEGEREALECLRTGKCNRVKSKVEEVGKAEENGTVCENADGLVAEKTECKKDA